MPAAGSHPGFGRARRSVLTSREAGFLTERDGVFQATVSETGWPYVQFRSGPPAERGILIRVAAFDRNGPSHMPIRLSDAERDGEMALRRNRIARLEQELAAQATLVDDLGT